MTETETQPKEPTMLDRLQSLVGSAELKALWADESAWGSYGGHDGGVRVSCLFARLPTSTTTLVMLTQRKEATLLHDEVDAVMLLGSGETYLLSCSHIDDGWTPRSAPLSPTEIEDLRRRFGDLLVWNT